MKTVITYLPNDPIVRQEITDALSQEYSLAESFKLYCKLYNNNVDARQHEDFEKKKSLQSLVSTSEKDVTWGMFLLFTIGMKHTAFYLVNSLLNGFGTVANEFLTSLTISIGLKLGDEDVIEIMKGEEPIETHIQNCAKKCVKKILKNSEALEERTHLTYQELIGYSKDFDLLVQAFGHSYYNSIEDSNDKYHLADFVELVRIYRVPTENLDSLGVGMNDSDCCNLI